jgi:hypothetical protein
MQTKEEIAAYQKKWRQKNRNYYKNGRRYGFHRSAVIRNGECRKTKNQALRDIVKEYGIEYVSREYIVMQLKKYDYEFIPFNII